MEPLRYDHERCQAVPATPTPTRPFNTLLGLLARDYHRGVVTWATYQARLLQAHDEHEKLGYDRDDYQRCHLIAHINWKAMP